MTELTTIRERGSYAVGVGIGGNLQKGGIEFDPEIFLRGLMIPFVAACRWVKPISLAIATISINLGWIVGSPPEN